MALGLSWLLQEPQQQIWQRVLTVSCRASPVGQNDVFGVFLRGYPSTVPALNCQRLAPTETCSRALCLVQSMSMPTHAPSRAVPGNVWKKDGLYWKCSHQGHEEHLPLNLKDLTSFQWLLSHPMQQKAMGEPQFGPRYNL